MINEPFVSPTENNFDARAVLEARAKSLARAREIKKPEASDEMLIFRLAREYYSLETKFVHAVFTLTDLTPLPNVKPPLYGLTSWRGDVLTVLDLRGLFGAPLNALDDLARVIVLGDKFGAFGILADFVDSIKEIELSSIFPLPENQRDRQHIRGVTSDAVLVIDAAGLIRQQID